MLGSDITPTDFLLIDAYEPLMEFVAKHISDKFYLIDNINTSIRGVIVREVIFLFV